METERVKDLLRFNRVLCNARDDLYYTFGHYPTEKMVMAFSKTLDNIDERLMSELDRLDPEGKVDL